MQTLAAEQAADANEAMIEMGSRSKGSGATSNALEGALGEFAEYMVPEELGAALQARGGKSVPSSISVKRKRESTPGEGDGETESAKKVKKPVSAAKKAKNKMKKQKKKARDRAKKQSPQ